LNEDVKSLLLDMADIDELKKTVNGELELGTDPLAIVKALNEALYEVGERYERGDLFLSELMMIGYLASEITNVLKPHMVGEGRETGSKVVFGTVKGDIHDIGKNVVIMMLQSAGFEVIDLGVDVSSERFVESVKNNGPDVLCMSSLLTSTMNEMRKVMDALGKAGLRGDVQVVVGGRPITQKFAQEVGAEGHARDAISAVRVIRELVEEGR
jgi:5-methyltetrahydrofolate--homocysteine methyltransferase